MARAKKGRLPPSDGPLGQFGWSDPEARWIQLVCEHSGMFLASQYIHWRGCHRSTGPRFIERLVDAGVARLHPLPRTGDGRPPQFCHLFGKALYRALGLREIRHRRIPNDSSLIWARLLSLDAVIEHPELPWLSGEDSKVRWTDELGVPRDALPSKLYPAKDGSTSTRRYFAPRKMPVAGNRERSTFVYADPGRKGRKELESWASAHTRLWAALRKRGVAVEVAVVARTLSARARADGWLEGRVGSRSPFTPDDADQLEAMERLLLEDRKTFYRTAGGIGPGLHKLGRFRRAKKQGSWEDDEGIIDTFSTRVSERVAGTGHGT